MEKYQISEMLHISSMPQTTNKSQYNIHAIIFPTGSLEVAKCICSYMSLQ
jgi:hypothetical protein